MKKIKLLTGLAGVAGLAACIVPITTVCSCNKGSTPEPVSGKILNFTKTTYKYAESRDVYSVSVSQKSIVLQEATKKITIQYNVINSYPENIAKFTLVDNDTSTAISDEITSELTTVGEYSIDIDLKSKYSQLPATSNVYFDVKVGRK